MKPELPQFKSANDVPKVYREVVSARKPVLVEIPVTSSEFSDFESGAAPAAKERKPSKRLALARLGLSLLATAFALMGSWFVWFRVDRGFWPFQYSEEKITIGMGGSGAAPLIHIPELLVSVTFYLVLFSLVLMAIGTWKKMPKPKRIKDKE